MTHTRTRDPRGRLEDAPEDHVAALAMSGDDGAFTELVRRRQKRVRDMLRRLCGNHALADDLAQKTFVRAWRGIGALRDPGAFGGWLKRVAVNAWLAEKRREPAPIDDDEDGFLAAVDPAPSPERSVASIDLERALTRLGPAERLCVVLAHGEGMTHAEIAEATRLPLGTVKSHVLRGSEKLKRIYAGVNRDD
jgi:RNA polymerase sigma-70 factor (ECF subfamily)